MQWKIGFHGKDTMFSNMSNHSILQFIKPNNCYHSEMQLMKSKNSGVHYIIIIPTSGNLWCFSCVNTIKIALSLPNSLSCWPHWAFFTWNQLHPILFNGVYSMLVYLILVGERPLLD